MKSNQAFAAAVVAASLLTSASLSDAQVIFSTNFDDYDPTHALSQQRGWDTDDKFDEVTETGESDVVRNIVNYSSSDTDLLALLGGFSGFAPGRQSISVWRPFSTSGILTGGAGADTLRFAVTSSITSSSDPLRPNEDSFGWAFRDASGAVLFRVAFEPFPEPEYRGVTFIDSLGNRTNSDWLVGIDSIYDFVFDVGIGANGDTLNVWVTQAEKTTSLLEVALRSGTGTNIAQIAAQWDILDPTVNSAGDPTQYGSNSLIFENYSVSVVPEPASALLLSVGLFSLLGIRRRS